MLLRRPQDLGAVQVSRDKPLVRREDIGIKLGWLREVEAVAEILVVGPLLIDPIVDKRRLDLDDPDITPWSHTEHIRTAAVGERDFGEAAEVVGRTEKSHHAALNPEGSRR